jgi:hypothetical protein
MSDLTKRARELLSKATSGPWKMGANGTGAFWVHALTPDGKKTPTIGKVYDSWESRCPDRPNNGKANGELVAEAPELIRQLCDALDRVEDEQLDCPCACGRI